MPIWFLIAICLFILVIAGVVAIARALTGPHGGMALGIGVTIVLLLGLASFVWTARHDRVVKIHAAQEVAAEVAALEQARLTIESGRAQVTPPTPSEPLQPAAVIPRATPSAPAAPLVPGTATPPSISLDEEGESISVQPRPAWVDSPGAIEPDGTVVTIVRTDPQPNVSRCLAELNEAIVAATRNYAEQTIQQRLNQRYIVHRLSRGELWNIAQQAKPETYTAPFSSSAGDMVQMHARLRFTPQVEQSLLASVQRLVMSQRMALVMLAGITVLAALAAAFGYLRLDTATKGYYTWRLRGAAVAAFATVFIATLAIADYLGLDDNVMFGP